MANGCGLIESKLTKLRKTNQLLVLNEMELSDKTAWGNCLRSKA